MKTTEKKVAGGYVEATYTLPRPQAREAVSPNRRRLSLGVPPRPPCRKESFSVDQEKYSTKTHGPYRV